MSLFTKWSFYLFMALAAIARGQTAEPKDPGKSNTAILYGQDNVSQPHQVPGQGVSWTVDYFPQLLDQQSGLFAYREVGDHSTGMSLAAVDNAVREHLKLPKGQGLIATSVAPQGMAARAGICENDILLTLGDAPLGKAEDLEERLKAAGDKPLGLVLLHQGAKKTVQVQPQIKVTFGPVQPQPPAFWIGVSVSPVEPALRAHLRLPADQGLLATEVVAEWSGGQGRAQGQRHFAHHGREAAQRPGHADRPRPEERRQVGGRRDSAGRGSTEARADA